MGKWEYLEDDEHEAFERIRKTSSHDDNYAEYNASNKKDKERKMWARSRKLKEFEALPDVSET